MKKSRLGTILISIWFCIVLFVGWWVSGLHFGHKPGDFDPRADENSEGECP